MFVTRKKYNQDVESLRSDIDRVRAVVVEIHGEKAYFEALDRINNQSSILDDDTAAGNFLETEVKTNDATPLQPVETVDEKGNKKISLPSRAEYDDRVKEAIKLFRENHPRSEVERILNVSRKTARKYLQMAIAKRQVAKSKYEQLNK